MKPQIVPTRTRKQGKSLVTDNIEGWQNFAQRITKNPFVKLFLLQRDGCHCKWCNKTLEEKGVIHHISYNHSCAYKVTLRIPAPTKVNPKKTRVIPDCENCRTNNQDRFMSCMDKLVLVHGYCNKLISVKNHEVTTIELSS